MARVLIPSAETAVRVMPFTAAIADFSEVARNAVPFSAVDTNLWSVDVDGELSPWWFAFGSDDPTDWSEAIGAIDLLDYNTTDRLTYAFTRAAGSDIYAFPRGVSKANWDYHVDCDEIEPGLYVVELGRDYYWYDLFLGTTVFSAWTDRIGEIYTGASGNANSYGPVSNYLSVDYEDDWQWIDGIEDLGFAFSPDRVTTQVAPGSGVKGKRSSPRHTEMMMAAQTVGIENTDVVFVIWAQTLLSGTSVRSIIRPMNGDAILANDATWIVKMVSQNTDNSQWRCLCRRSTKEA